MNEDSILPMDVLRRREKLDRLREVKAHIEAKLNGVPEGFLKVDRAELEDVKERIKTIEDDLDRLWAEEKKWEHELKAEYERQQAIERATELEEPAPTQSAEQKKSGKKGKQ